MYRPLAGSSGERNTRLDLGRVPVRLPADRAGADLPLIRPDVGAREGPRSSRGSPCRDDHLIPPPYRDYTPLVLLVLPCLAILSSWVAY